MPVYHPIKNEKNIIHFIISCGGSIHKNQFYDFEFYFSHICHFFNSFIAKKNIPIIVLVSWRDHQHH